MGLFKPNIEKLKAKGDIQALCKALNFNSDDTIRCAAAKALGEIKDVKAVESLIAAFKDRDGDVRREAAWALGEIKDVKAVESLIIALKDRDKIVRRGAAGALGGIKDIKVVESLITTLKDNDELVRHEAAWALGEIKDVKAVGPLIVALKDSDENVDVRIAAAEVHGKIKGVKAVKSLIVALKDSDENVDVRIAAAEALKNIGDDDSIKAVKQFEQELTEEEKRIKGIKKDALCFAFTLGTIPSSDKEFIKSLIVKFAPNVEPRHYWVERVQKLPTPQEIAANILVKTGETGYRANLEKVEVCDFNISLYGVKGKFAVMYF